MAVRLRHHARAAPRSRAAGFTLLELLVAMVSVAALAAVMLATLARVRGTARSFVCKNNLKTIGFEFNQFADDATRPYRGDSDELGRRGFAIEDFQERLYRIDEFWDQATPGQVAYDAAAEPMICPAASPELTRSAGVPCSDYAVGPVAHVSIGFNMRLDRASVQIQSRWVLQPVRLTGRVLEHGSVPLAFDVDGATADERNVRPYYAAPPAGDPGRYGSGLFWFPGARHGKRVNAAFVGGHVLSSSDPETAAGWRWSYQPRTD